MNTGQAYDQWAGQYDTNENKTRDLEARAIRESLGTITFRNCLEIGCGTGKNTVWLSGQADHVMAIDLSEEMMAIARTKVDPAKVEFRIADIQGPWDFTDRKFDLVSFSLVLEHIGDLVPVFTKVAAALAEGGHLYIGELHPFKQYSGSKARFETETGMQVVTCFNHHLSDFISGAMKAGLALTDLREYFDGDDRNGLPRILALVFKKPIG